MKNGTKRLSAALLTLATLILLTTCLAAWAPSGFAADQGAGGPDYADAANWLRFGGDGDKPVDVFAVYPTVTASMDEADRPYVRLDSGMMRDMAAGWLAENAGLVADTANLYAPLYRQLNGVELDTLNSDTFASYTNAIPRDDIFAAFEYYLTHVNKGERPFLLLGNSQGAQLVLELATTFLGDEAHSVHDKNHIATYAIGCSVTEGQIALNPSLGFSRRRDDTGVIVSWNTTAPSEIASGAYTGFGTWKPGALVTNPISWTTDDAPVGAEMNLASLVVYPDRPPELVEAYADATADSARGVLVASTVPEGEYESMSSKISKFHRHDIAFYYESVRRNIAERIAAFLP